MLKANSSKLGLLASALSGRAKNRDYLSVFARDVSICVPGMVLSQDRELLKTAKHSLDTLAKHQADNGQIPNYVRQDGYVDFWRLGCIDATLWWLLAVYYFDQIGGQKLKTKYKKHIDAAIKWLYCQEHVKDGLLMQNEASDWADIMPRSGKVLYSNALWILVKDKYGLKRPALTRKSFNNLFFPFDDDVDTLLKCEKKTVIDMRKRQEPVCHYLSYVNYGFWGHDLDVFGNSLALLAGAVKRNLRRPLFADILQRKPIKKLPMPVLFNPIRKNSPEWRGYMESYKQNLPYQYHNGGIWPFAACFFAMALYKFGFKKEARAELEAIAYANSVNNWEFNEWFQAKTGEPLGMKKQSWNAGAFIWTYHFIDGGADW